MAIFSSLKFSLNSKKLIKIQTLKNTLSFTLKTQRKKRQTKVFHNQADSTHFAYSFQKSTKHVGNIFGAWEVLMAHFLYKAINMNYFCGNLQ